MSTLDDLLMRFLDSPLNVIAAAGVLLLALLGLIYLDQVRFYRAAADEEFRRANEYRWRW